MKAVINLDSLVQRNPKLIANQMDGEIVMMSIDNGEYYGLDEVGSRIWELLESQVLVSSLIDSLMVEFNVSKEECERDIVDFLSELFEKGLLLVGNEPHS
jgi:hypothetical protein